MQNSHLHLVDVSDIFYFFCSGEGKGESGATWRGGWLFIESPRRSPGNRVGEGFGYFLFMFSPRGRGKGESEAPGGGESVLY